MHEKTSQREKEHKKGLKEERNLGIYAAVLLSNRTFSNLSTLRHFSGTFQFTDHRCFMSFLLPGWTLSSKWKFPLMKNKSFGPLSSFAFLPIRFYRMKIRMFLRRLFFACKIKRYLIMRYWNKLLSSHTASNSINPEPLREKNEDSQRYIGLLTRNLNFPLHLSFKVSR